MAKPSPVGTWESPVTSMLITSKSKGLGSPAFDSKGYAYWLEGRPTEGGRQVVVRRAPDGTVEDVTPGVDSGLSVRTRVHEYGGGAWWLGGDYLYFTNFADQRLFMQQLYPTIQEPVALTAEGSALRFADGRVDEARQRIICVVEDHTPREGSKEAANYVGAVDLATGAVTPLTQGADFYSYPRLSPDGQQLAWMQWDHPNMPWDSTAIYVAEVLQDGTLGSKRLVAGGEGISATQPCWSTVRGGLYFVSDESDWWNLYYEEAPGQVVLVCHAPGCEFASPAWVFGVTMATELPDGKLLCCHYSTEAPGTLLSLVDPFNGSRQQLETPYTAIGTLSAVQLDGKLKVGTSVSSPSVPSQLVYVDVANSGELPGAVKDGWQVLAKSTDLEIDPGYLPEPEVIEYPTNDDLTAFMVYYPPKNKDHSLPPGELPPLLVQIHGGPTSRTSVGWSLGKAYWTSRGFAVADINYGGSTGYGRKYRDRLKGSWGVVDVDDCCNAAKYLAAAGLVDPKRLTITGGSAGGYTTLACMAFRDVFSAGTSHYGVADCELLAQETHKFESRYLDSLIGPYPETQSVYKERSPINHLDKVSKPIMFFQGDEDKVVPPNQAVICYEALRDRGLTTGLVMFQGEQHGFRKAENIRRALDGELYFYGKALGLPVSMPEGLEAPDIINLPQ